MIGSLDKVMPDWEHKKKNEWLKNVIFKDIWKKW